jgi:transposase
MYGREQRVLLRHYLEQGLSKAELARQLGIARRTVYYWLETGQLDRELDNQPVRYAARPPVVRKIDRFRDIILARLTAFPRLTAVRLYEEIRAAGYSGGYTQVKDYVRLARPAPVPEPLIRFETLPGQQGQVDFAEFRLPWGKRYALVVVLAYSRLLWLQFYARQTMGVLMRGLEEAFAFCGGVPGELLFDQLKAVIIDDQRAVGGRLLENAEFLRFANHWDFRIRACRPYRAKTKGKVERPIRYVRESFFYGRHFLNDADLNAQARSWMVAVANQRQHRTTGERPQLRFERDEQAALIPLAMQRYRSLVLPSSPPGRIRPPRSALPTVEHRDLADYARLVGVHR